MNVQSPQSESTTRRLTLITYYRFITFHRNVFSLKEISIILFTKLVIYISFLKYFIKIPLSPATSILVSSGIETEWVTNQRGEKYFLKRQNDKFEKFFSEQKTCETEEEWKNCLEVMRTDLPQAFRLNSSRLEKITEFQNRLPLSIKIFYINTYVNFSTSLFLY